MINITCNNKDVRTGTCADVGDSNVVAYISFFDTTNNTERKLYQPVYGDFKTSTAYLFDLSGNSITLTYADSNKTRTELEDLLVDCCGCVGGDGTVTSFSAGNLSPLFTTNVATPTTTPALSFNLSNCNQYQVFGRVAAGTGAPSYVPLNPIAFNGLAIPNREVVFGTGTGITSNPNLTFDVATYRLSIGVLTGAGTHSLNVGINNTTSYRCLTVGDNIKFDGTLGYLLGVGYDINLNMSANSAYSLFVGQNINVASTARVAYSDIIGVGHAINDTVQLFYTVISGQGNSINGSGYVQYCGVAGYNNTFNSSGGIAASFAFGRNNSINHSYSLAMGYGVASTASNQANFAFANGYRFMADGTTQWMAIAPTTGYVTINNIPTAASATDILVSNGGVVSTRTVSSLGIPVITPAALTKTDDTNVTISLGGTPATALLQGVSLTMGWSGVLAISRGGTGLGSLGTAGQLLRTNSSATALEYFTPTFLTGNQTITLIGDITGSGATSIVTTIAANAVTTSKIANTAVTFAKFQNINTNRLLGRSSAGSGSVEEISIGTGLSLSGGTLSASGGGGSAVWKVQGGSTDATTNTQSIYHNANVWLGDGSSSSSSYRLQVSGLSYFTGSLTLNNITTIQAWNNAASQQLKIAQLDSSNVFNYAENYLKIVGAGGNAGDITISAYPHTRKDTISAYPRNVLVTNSSGDLLSLPGECYKNDNVNTTLSSDESHSDDSTWRTVTWDTVNTPSWSQYGVDTTSGNMKMKLPTSTYEYGTHLIFVTINYTGGTASEVNAEIRINGSTVIGSATTNATASKNTLTFFAVVNNNSTYQGLVISLHIRVATGTGSISVKSGSKMVMIAAGAPLPA